MDQTPGSKDESKVAESQRLGEEVDVERRVQLLISFTTQVVFGYIAQVKPPIFCFDCCCLMSHIGKAVQPSSSCTPLTLAGSV